MSVSLIRPLGHLLRHHCSLTTTNVYLRHQFRWHISRGLSGKDEARRKLNTQSTLYYVTAAGVLFAGATYAAVPLYRMFCQVS